MGSIFVDSPFLANTNATRSFIGRSGGVRWCEKANAESDGLRSSSPNSSLNHYERNSIAAILYANERLVTVQASIEALQEHTRFQKMVLGISSPLHSSEVSEDIVITPEQGICLANFMNDKTVNAIVPHHVMIKGSLSNTAEQREQRINTEKIISERNGLKRLLTEAQKKIEDLRYEHTQQARRLQKELDEERDTVSELRAKESFLLNEAFSAKEEVKQLKNDAETLCSALNNYKVNEQSLQDEGFDKRHVPNLKPLEDALTAANKMNGILLENADRQDAMYRSALSELDCLRDKILETNAKVESDRKTYKDILEEMERGMVALRHFKEQLTQGKLLECAKQGKCCTVHEDEIGRFHVALNNAESLITMIKEKTATTTMTQTRAKCRDVSVQCDIIVECDKSVSTSSFLDGEKTIPVRELPVESRRLWHRCDKYREELEAMKQAHAIEIGLLTGKFMKAESELQSRRLQLYSAEQSRIPSTALCDVDMGVVQESFHLPTNNPRKEYTKSTKCLEVGLKERKKRNNSVKEKHDGNNIDGGDDYYFSDSNDGTLRGNLSADKVIGPSEVELQPPITVNLSARLKKETEEDRSLEQFEKTLRSEVMNSHRCFHCSEVKHSTQTCVWCSDRLKQSLGHLITGTNLCQSSYLQAE